MHLAKLAKVIEIWTFLLQERKNASSTEHWRQTAQTIKNHKMERKEKKKKKTLLETFRINVSMYLLDEIMEKKGTYSQINSKFKSLEQMPPN